jgi:mitogen-activated protein kinase organizer 1
VTCGSDRKLKLWNPYKSVSLKTYGGHGDEVMDASASCDSSQIVSCGLDKSVILWDVATGMPIRRFRGHAGPVTTVR